MYAIVETGGKQYKVSPGQTVDVDLLKAEKGAAVELDKVFVLSNGKEVIIGTPTVEGAKVIATSQGEFKDKKIIILKFKAKSHYDKKTGHRQSYTRLTIDKIVGPGIASEEVAEKKPRRRSTKKQATEKEVTKDGA